MALTKVTEKIYYLVNEKETDRPVLGYIKGDKYSLMVDAGNSKNHVEKFNSSVEKLNLRLPDYVAITHWHWDHSYGMNYYNNFKYDPIKLENFDLILVYT